MAIRDRRQRLRYFRDLRQLPRAGVVVSVVAGVAGEARLPGAVVVVDKIQDSQPGVEVDVPLRLWLQHQPAQRFGRGDAQHLGRRNGYAGRGVHRATVLEVNPFVNEVVGGAAAVDGFDYLATGIKAAAASGVVLSERFEADAEPAPFGGPVEPPRQLPFALREVVLHNLARGVLEFQYGPLAFGDAAVDQPPVAVAAGPREPVARQLPPADALEDFARARRVLDRGAGAVGEAPLAVGGVVVDHSRCHSDFAQRVEKRLEEMVGVATVPFRGGDFRQRVADPFGVALVEERVDFAQRVGCVRHVDQLRLAASVAHRACYRVGGQDFAHAPDVDGSRRGDS